MFKDIKNLTDKNEPDYEIFYIVSTYLKLMS